MQQIKKRIKYDLPYPSLDEVNKFINDWDNLGHYTYQESALDKLFHKIYPENKELDDILIKVSCLNDFYSTNIFKPYLVAKHILELNVDQRLKDGDIFLVEEISKVPGISAKLYSFASKYCSHHNSIDYPIYDSYVHRMLLQLNKQYHFYTFEEKDLKYYPKFKEILLSFQKYFQLTIFTLKDIDKYLWLTGKEYMPNKNYSSKKDKQTVKD